MLLTPTHHSMPNPTSAQSLLATKKRCLAIVNRYAALSAGLGALPLPGLDVLTDIGLLVRVVEAINHEFGLTPAQLALLQPEKRILAFEAITAAGSILLGKAVTGPLILTLLRRSGVKLPSRQSARLVPIAGQVMGAAAGYIAFRTIAKQHIAACASVKEHLAESVSGQ